MIDKAKQYRKLDPFFWTLIPLAYMLFALLNGLVLKWPIPGAKDSPFAYFFINVNKYGWAFVGQMGGDHFYRLPLSWLCALWDEKYQAEIGCFLVKTEHYSDEKSCFLIFLKNVEFFSCMSFETVI